MPKTFVDFYHAMRRGDRESASDLLEKIVAFQAIYDIGKYASRHIKATKSALSLIGICDDLPADPFNRFLEPERDRVAEILSRIGVLSETR